MKKIICLILSLILACALVSCDSSEKSNPWENATYTENTEFGNGNLTVYVDVEVLGHSVSFTIKTDKENLGDALMEHKLITGEKGPYGLYVKYVNGIEADYDKTKSYWAFEKDGESLMTGVDGEKISDGAHYEIIYTEQ